MPGGYGRTEKEERWRRRRERIDDAWCVEGVEVMEEEVQIIKESASEYTVLQS